jgi:hypothetical protein
MTFSLSRLVPVLVLLLACSDADPDGVDAGGVDAQVRDAANEDAGNERDASSDDAGGGVLCDCCTGLVPASGFDRCEQACGGRDCVVGARRDAGADAGSDIDSGSDAGL